MDILSSGSFVTLDNRDKVEQLIFTAKTLATEASRTEGFQSSGPSNQQLALEMWKGAEYMCRANEEPTIKNIFLSNFLKRLSEVAKESGVLPPVVQQVSRVTSPPEPEPESNSNPVHASNEEGSDSPNLADEYLGVLPPSECSEVVQRTSYADECVPEGEKEIADLVDHPASPIPESSPETPLPTAEAEPAKVQDASASNTNSTNGQSVEVHQQAAESPQPEVEKVGAIVLAEKEPYNFDSCTITTVLQLLPENEGTRKCIVSTRSHDFPPAINVAMVRADATGEDLGQILNEMLGRYRAELPGLAAEKIKKEKPANKKKNSKSNSEAKQSGSAVRDEQTNAESEPVGVVNSVAGQTGDGAKDQHTLFV